MSDNIIDFKPRKKQAINPVEIFNLTMTKDADGMYEVFMEVNDGFTDNEVFDAIFCAAMKYADDHGLTEEVELDDLVELELDPE